jgi:hypothetical protein
LRVVPAALLLVAGWSRVGVWWQTFISFVGNFRFVDFSASYKETNEISRRILLSIFLVCRIAGTDIRKALYSYFAQKPLPKFWSYGISIFRKTPKNILQSTLTRWTTLELWFNSVLRAPLVEESFDILRHAADIRMKIYVAIQVQSHGCLHTKFKV